MSASALFAPIARLFRPSVDDLQHALREHRRGTALIKANELIVDQANEIAELQRALAFWLPHVPGNDTEIADRAGDDAMRLCGYNGEDEVCAETRGWITLRKPQVWDTL